MLQFPSADAKHVSGGTSCHRQRRRRQPQCQPASFQCTFTPRPQQVSLLLWCLLSLCLKMLLVTVDASSRFEMVGPILTVTLKDPQVQDATSKLDNSEHFVVSGRTTSSLVPRPILSTTSASASKQTTTTKSFSSAVFPWLDWSSIHPVVSWSVQSAPGRQPLPQWWPCLKFVRATFGYQTHSKDGADEHDISGSSVSTSSGSASSSSSSTNLPAWFQGCVKFSKPIGNLEITPYHSFQTGVTNVNVQFSRGSNYLTARLGGGGNNNISGGSGQPRLPWYKTLVQTIQGSCLFHLPFATVSEVRLSPTLDLTPAAAENGSVTCQLLAVTATGRTRALLQLEYQNPTLSISHALDARNTITPTISLYDAKIVYTWDLLLGDYTQQQQPATATSSNGPDGSTSFSNLLRAPVERTSRLRVAVDPMTAIHMTWTDQSAGNTGSWVTDVKLPLAGVSLQALAADVRVRREFRF